MATRVLHPTPCKFNRFPKGPAFYIPLHRRLPVCTFKFSGNLPNLHQWHIHLVEGRRRVRARQGPCRSEPLDRRTRRHYSAPTPVERLHPTRTLARPTPYEAQKGASQWHTDDSYRPKRPHNSPRKAAPAPTGRASKSPKGFAPTAFATCTSVVMLSWESSIRMCASSEASTNRPASTTRRSTTASSATTSISVTCEATSQTTSSRTTPSSITSICWPSRANAPSPTARRWPSSTKPADARSPSTIASRRTADTSSPSIVTVPSPSKNSRR